MSALPSTTPMTIEPFEQLPSDGGIQELLDGCLVLLGHKENIMV